jgi:hypothetical protein
MGHDRHFLSAISLGLLHSFINVEGLNPFDFKVKREVRDNVRAVRATGELPAPARLKALVFEDIAPLTFPNLSFLTAVHGSYVFPSVGPD